MTLLSICQAVANDSGFQVPQTIVGNQDATASMLLSLINKSGRTLARKPWQRLQKEFPFSTVASQSQYALPTDYGFYQADTAWSRTNYWNIRGSLSPAEWQRYKSGIQTTTPRSRFRVFGNFFTLDPTPSSIESMVIEYVSSFWVATAAAPTVGAQNTFLADTDVSFIDEYILELDLTWRFLERKGLAYAEAKDEAVRMIEKYSGTDTPSAEINLADSFGPWPPVPTLPVTGYS